MADLGYVYNRGWSYDSGSTYDPADDSFTLLFDVATSDSTLTGVNDKIGAYIAASFGEDFVITSV